MEPITAVLAENALSEDTLDAVHPHMRELLRWHASEEIEHKAVAFDILAALGGSHEWRVRWMRRVTTLFWADVFRQTARNLRRDGTLWQWRTWKSAAVHLLGARGVLRQTYGPWRAYFRRDFHPNQMASTLHEQWLHSNAAAYSRVG